MRSSALTLGGRAPLVVAACYAFTALALAAAARLQGLGGLAFWLLWAVASAGMLREALLLRSPDLPRAAFGRHFSRQVQLGALVLLALIAASRP